MSAAQISSGGWTGSAFSDDEEDSESYGTQTDSDDSDDDVPLAQRLPGALRVQKSMRVEERAKKELIRRETRATTTSQSASPVRARCFGCFACNQLHTACQSKTTRSGTAYKETTRTKYQYLTLSSFLLRISIHSSYQWRRSQTCTVHQSTGETRGSRGQLNASHSPTHDCTSPWKAP